MQRKDSAITRIHKHFCRFVNPSLHDVDDLYLLLRLRLSCHAHLATHFGVEREHVRPFLIWGKRSTLGTPFAVIVAPKRLLVMYEKPINVSGRKMSSNGSRKNKENL